MAATGARDRGVARGEQGDQARAVERLANSDLYLVSGSGSTSADVRAHTLRVQALERRRPAVVVVDCVQLLRDREGDGRSREQTGGRRRGR